VPQPGDAVEVVRHVRWFLGLGPRPRFGRFTYWEKFDYFAVFWGMAIIGSSGYVLWFHGFFSRFLPGWIFNVTHLVHGEEALLAVGFIFTIHFFNSHLRPKKFPMDLVIFTGRVSEDELRTERPEEYERLIREGRLAALRTEPPPRWLRNFGRILGTAGVVTGLVIVTLILVAILGR
jgi:cytochrome b subunit of formate dehydrogenase